MEGHRDDSVVVRKGPWMAEEDEILLDYVKNHGPRDWSSIRTKGLLPRTGKSCRLRWVNKLKPDLKTGCKFSSEEERVVIDLQAQFGNKWARIATYLPGRTDNDVKNFWSTRQKRLARSLQMSKLHKIGDGNGPVFQESSPKFNAYQEISEGQSSKPPCAGNSDAMKMMELPGLMGSNSIDINMNHPQVGIVPVDPIPYVYYPEVQFPFAPDPPSSLQLPAESQDLLPLYVDPSLYSFMFGCQDPAGGNDIGFPVGLPEIEPDTGQHGATLMEARKDPSTPESFFDDFPADMFDYIESLPNSSDW